MSPVVTGLVSFVRRLRLIATVVAGSAILVVAAMSVVASGPPSVDVPPALGTAVARLLPDDECTDLTTAASRLGAGLDGWTVVQSPGVASSPCVSAAFDSARKQIVLIPVTAPSTRQAILAAGSELRERCLGRSEAVAFLQSVLAQEGVDDAVVRTDGPVVYPTGDGDAVRAHIAAGCFVYSVSGRSADGQPIYYLTGPAN